MKEIWLPVKEYEGLYEVSNLGNVRSLNYNHTGQKKVLIPFESKSGYFQVVLWKNGKRKILLVHRIVSQAFIPNLFDEPQVNHIDENKHNNFCGTPENDFNDGNLEWCDSKYNNNFGTARERMVEKQSNPVLQITKTGELVREWPSTMEAGRNGFQQGNIVLCCQCKRKTHKGYIWKYKE